MQAKGEKRSKDDRDKTTAIATEMNMRDEKRSHTHTPRMCECAV